MATKSTTTKPAAKKTAATKPETPKERVIKAGGKKGEAVVAALTKDPSQSRAQLAETVGCTVGRVGEVLRHLAKNGTPEEQALVKKHEESKPARKVAEKKANPTPAARGKKAPSGTTGDSVKKATASRSRRQAAKKTAESTPEPANA